MNELTHLQKVQKAARNAALNTLLKQKKELNDEIADLMAKANPQPYLIFRSCRASSTKRRAVNPSCS